MTPNEEIQQAKEVLIKYIGSNIVFGEKGYIIIIDELNIKSIIEAMIDFKHSISKKSHEH